MKNTQKRKTPPQSIGPILENVLSQRGYLTVCKEWGVCDKWAEIAGETLATVTYCDRVEDGVLFVRVKSAPWRQELAYMKPQLLQNVQKVCQTIKDIVFC